MFGLFANQELVYPENASVQSNIWTWLLMFAIFSIVFIYYGLIWTVALKIFGQKDFYKKTKFYYVILTIAITATVIDFLCLLIYPGLGVIIAIFLTGLINFLAARYWWKLNYKQSLILAILTIFATAILLIF